MIVISILLSLVWLLLALTVLAACRMAARDDSWRIQQSLPRAEDPIRGQISCVQPRRRRDAPPVERVARDRLGRKLRAPAKLSVRR